MWKPVNITMTASLPHGQSQLNKECLPPFAASQPGGGTERSDLKRYVDKWRLKVIAKRALYIMKLAKLSRFSTRHGNFLPPRSHKTIRLFSVKGGGGGGE